jgi:hypothetical protein
LGSFFFPPFFFSLFSTLIVDFDFFFLISFKTRVWSWTYLVAYLERKCGRKNHGSHAQVQFLLLFFFFWCSSFYFFSFKATSSYNMLHDGAWAIASEIVMALWVNMNVSSFFPMN